MKKLRFTFLGCALAITFLLANYIQADAPAHGTCCPQDGAICVVGEIVIFDAWYKWVGPCN